MANSGMNWIKVCSIALNDLRGSWADFFVFNVCLALGVASIATVGLLSHSITTTLDRDARILLGGDLAYDIANQPIDASDLSVLAPGGFSLSSSVFTNSIVSTNSEKSVAVALKAVDDSYPLLGSVITGSGTSPTLALKLDEIIVGPTLLPRLGVDIGDTVSIGNADFRIVDTVLGEPDRVGSVIGIGPRVIISDKGLERAGILLPGALVRYYYRVLVPDGVSLSEHISRVESAYQEAPWRVRQAGDLQPQISRITERLTSYLTLAGLGTLLIGGCGIGIAARHYFLKKLPSMGTLKCLGALRKDVFRIYLIQIVYVSSIGIAAGLVFGGLLPFSVRLIPQELFPVRIDYHLALGPMIVAAVFGIATTLLFTMLPLASAIRVSPARIFRAHGEPLRVAIGKTEVIIVIGSILVIQTILLLTVRPIVVGALALPLLVIAVGLMVGLARLLVYACKGMSANVSGLVRLAINGLARPGSPITSVLVGLACGFGVLTVVTMLENNLLNEIDRGVPDRAPSHILVDVQPSQSEPLLNMLRETEGVKVLQALPMLRARVTRIAGNSIDPALVSDDVRWTTRRDRGLTYADEKPAETKLVAGDWWAQDYEGEPLVSIEEELAVGFDVSVGDTLTFNVLGRPITATIHNLREEIDYTSGRLDFLFILNSKALEAAPHTLIVSLEVEASRESSLLVRLADQYPNVTPISVRNAIDTVVTTLERIGFAVRAVALVTILSGVLVLIGAVNSARVSQLYEASVFKVLGARRRELLAIFLGEYGVLGFIAGFVGVLVGGIVAWGLVVFVFEIEWQLQVQPAFQTIILAIICALAVGMAALWRDLGLPAARLLRSE